MNELDHLKEILADKKKEVEQDSIYDESKSLNDLRHSSQNIFQSNDSMIVNIPMALN